jgi:hypothetical protein
MRTMEPREKGWFDSDMKVAHFFLGSGTISGGEESWVGFRGKNAYPTTCQWMEIRRFRGS